MVLLCVGADDFVVVVVVVALVAGDRCYRDVIGAESASK